MPKSWLQPQLQKRKKGTKEGRNKGRREGGKEEEREGGREEIRCRMETTGSSRHKNHNADSPLHLHSTCTPQLLSWG
jgi:hypothetical protein